MNITEKLQQVDQFRSEYSLVDTIYSIVQKPKMAEVSDLDTCGARQEAELSLLREMYPDDIQWNEKRRELTYRPEQGGALTIRLPNDYPGKSNPELVSATSKDNGDLRDVARSQIFALHLRFNEEALDAIVQAFDELLKQRPQVTGVTSPTITSRKPSSIQYKTVVIWLHHLLNTNKRKLALNSGVDSTAIKGVTKPGYPGVLVYSGNADVVEAHVAELRNQKWQAFQVRYDELGPSPWNFHTTGIVEVETMSEVTGTIADETSRQTFLKAIGVK